MKPFQSSGNPFQRLIALATYQFWRLSTDIYARPPVPSPFGSTAGALMYFLDIYGSLSFREYWPVHQIPKIRHAVRILLVDERDRLFLFQCQDPKNKSSVFWCPVGGGIEAGETPEIAIRREVKEETGLADFTPGPHIWNREVIVSFNGSLIHSKEKWFFSKVNSFDVDVTGFSDIEYESVLNQKWWTLEELERTSEQLTPRRLPELLRQLLEGNFPETPLNLILEESYF